VRRPQSRTEKITDAPLYILAGTRQEYARQKPAVVMLVECGSVARGEGLVSSSFLPRGLLAAARHHSPLPARRGGRFVR
jgi:hypothetical protein